MLRNRVVGARTSIDQISNFLVCSVLPLLNSQATPTYIRKWDSTPNQLQRMHLHSNMTGTKCMENHQKLSLIPAEYDWKVMDILRETFSAMVLNTPITNPKFATTIWRKANFKMLVDGGGNELHKILFNESREDCPRDQPHVVCGDFDSIHTDVLDFYQKLGVKIIHTPDQEETDFFKGLRILSENTDNRTVVVYCENVGRLDHMLQNLNTLYKCSKHGTLSKYNIFLLNHGSLTWLLKPGSHVIHVPQCMWTDMSPCGLIPLGQPCYHVTTKGLKYNLHDEETKFGKMISTSNAYDTKNNETNVHISTDSELIWTMTVNEKICP